MAQYYQKINTLYKRDSKNNIIIGDYSLPEFEYLKDCLWDVSEKVDGTNMSYEIFFYGDGEIAAINIHGKTENANIPKDLLAVMEGLVNNDRFTDAFKRLSKDENGNEVYTWPKKVTIFGEGYGAKIQGGGRYSKTPKFIVFDIAIENNTGEEVYLLKNSVKDVAHKLGFTTVFDYPMMTITEAENIIKDIAKAVYRKNGNITMKDISEDDWDNAAYPGCMFSKCADDPNLVIEGFVLKSPLGLKTRQGKPIVVKIKVKDYLEMLKKGVDIG
jgi:hypothetical protein